MIKSTHPSPIGELTIVSDGDALAALVFDNHTKQIPVVAGAETGEDDIIRETRKQLSEYFAGRRDHFDLPLAPRGTPFRQRVWRELIKLRFGRTTSYSAIAAKIGAEKAVRAVGGSVGANPIGIVIPCHRVVGADGALTGFAGGLERKRFLLALEQRQGQLIAS